MDDDIVPIPGTKRRATSRGRTSAPPTSCSADDLQQLDAELPAAAGERYDSNGADDPQPLGSGHASRPHRDRQTARRARATSTRAC